MQFDHEKLHVYQAAIELVVLADKVIELLPRGKSYLADQLQRAVTSVPFNIAEGAGEYAGNEKIDFIEWQDVLQQNVQAFLMYYNALNL